MKSFKRTIITVISCLLIAATAGCGKTENKTENKVIKTDSGYSLNTAYTDDNLVDLSGEEFKYDEKNCYLSKNAGIGIKIKNEKLLELINNGKLEVAMSQATADDDYGFIFYFTSEQAMELLLSMPEDVDDEEFDKIVEQLDKGMFTYAQVIGISDYENDEESQQMKAMMEEQFENVEAIGTIDERTYYFAYNTDYSGLTLTDGEKTELQDMVNNIDTLKNGICIFPAEKSEPRENSVGTISGFKAKSLDNEEVTDDIFAGYDITMINVWATYCGSCKDEMKDLGELYDSIPEGMNMISICTDSEQEKELAKNILDKNGCKFITLIPDDVLTDTLLSNVSGVPTTFFVDSEGNVIGEPITGSRTKDKYLEELMERVEITYSEVNPV